MQSKRTVLLSTGCVCLVLTLFSSVLRAQETVDQDDAGKISLTRMLPRATQGPLWPPSEIVDKDGNFVLVGLVLTEIQPGVIVPIPNKAVLVDKNTVPPLDSNGHEDFTNNLGAPYKVIRELDLRPGSPDLDIVLYSLSYGPYAGDVGLSGKAGPRIPKAGDSAFNLNGALPSCPEIFPTPSQVGVFTRSSFALHEYPIYGFQGDQIAQDVITGQPIVPHLASGPNCGLGCAGENNADQRQRPPITLGRYLAGSAKMKITLTRFNEQVNAFTAARFDFKFENLLPHSMYTIWTVRKNVIASRPDIRLPNPLGVPAVVMTDEKGNGSYSTELTNPFPDPATDTKGMRMIGLAVDYHPNFQNWGACPAILGPGVDVHAAFNVAADGTRDLTTFITKEPPK